MNKVCGLCCTKIESFGVIKGKTEILNNVNLHIHCGELTAIIGPNGAGKSTFLKALLGEVPHSGELKFLDIKGSHTGNPLIGYVPQHLDFDSGTPTSVFDFFQAAKSKAPVWIFHSKSARKDIIESLSKTSAEHLIDKRLGSLSGGELQRVLLAMALDPIPDLLLLDEPVSGIDQSGLEMFYNLVSKIREKYDLSILLVSHDLPLVYKHADRVVFLDKTVKCVGSPVDVFENDIVIKTFGTSWIANQGENDGTNI